MNVFAWLRRLVAPAKAPPPAPPEASKPPLRRMKIREELLARARRKAKVDGYVNPFSAAAHPPAAMPPSGMAMDDARSGEYSSWASAQIQSMYADGVVFLGFPYLSALAQRPEYRVMVETIALEMTRRFVGFTAVGDAEAKAEKIKKMTAEWKRLKVRDHFRDALEKDGFFGRVHIYPVIRANDEDDDTYDWGEDGSNLGTGWDETSKSKVSIGSLKELRVIEPIWTYPTDYDAGNPLSKRWYKPKFWYVMGNKVHETRLITLVGRPVPDILKPAYSFGGLALTQMAKPYVDNWIRTRQSVSDMVYKFSTWVLATSMEADLQGEQAREGDVMSRAELFTNMSANLGCALIDKDSEDLKNVSAPISGLHELQSQSQEQMSAVSQIPLVKLTGISPSGLNASSEGEIKVFYDLIHARQERMLGDALHRLNGLTQLSLFGEVDPEIEVEFEALEEESESERSQRQNQDAQTDVALIDAGVIAPEESRARVADDPESPYSGIDKSKVPVPPGGGGAGGGDPGQPGGAPPLGPNPDGSGSPHQYAHLFGVDPSAVGPYREAGDFGQLGQQPEPSNGWAQLLGVGPPAAHPRHWSKLLGIDGDVSAEARAPDGKWTGGGGGGGSAAAAAYGGPDPLKYEGFKPPSKTIKAYKIFRTLKSKPGQIFPTQAGIRDATPIGEWVPAKYNPTPGLAPRPGWHGGEMPMAPQMRGKNGYIQPGYVWAEVEFEADRHDELQKLADASKTKDLPGQIPKGGWYRFKPNNARYGKAPWYISGAVKVNRLLKDDEVGKILADAGFADEARREQHLHGERPHAQAEDEALVFDDLIGWDFIPSELRDDDGQWTSGGSTGKASLSPVVIWKDKLYRSKKPGAIHRDVFSEMPEDVRKEIAATPEMQRQDILRFQSPDGRTMDRRAARRYAEANDLLDTRYTSPGQQPELIAEHLRKPAQATDELVSEALGLDDFNPSEPRRSDGEWTSGGAGGGKIERLTKAFATEGKGIARGDMPQVASKRIPEFKDWLVKGGVDVHEEDVDPASLKPTQKEFNSEAAQRVAAELLKPDHYAGLDKPILVSSDGYVLDGHHTWCGHILNDSHKVRIARIGMPIDDLLQAADDFTDGAGKRDNDNKPTSPAEPATAEGIIASVPGAKEKIADAEAKLAKGVATDAPVEKGGFKQANGYYVPDRERLHEDIISKALSKEAIAAAIPAPGEPPKITMLGGRGGSGKGWFTGPEGGVDAKKAIYVNADDIMDGLPGYEGWNAAHFHEEASDIANEIERRARRAGLNVVLDATMRTFTSAAARVSAYKKDGYRIAIDFMDCKPETSARRAVERFMKSGRYVPPAYILGSTSNIETFSKLKDFADDWREFNSETFPPKRIHAKADAR